MVEQSLALIRIGIGLITTAKFYFPQVVEFSFLLIDEAVICTISGSSASFLRALIERGV